MNKADHSKLIYSGKFPLPLDTATKRSYKIIVYRSTVSSGSIENIEIPELPENCFVLTHEDLKSKNHIKIDGEKIPVLADKRVNYIGEPILLIVGLSISTMKIIHKKINIQYKEDESKEEVIFFYRKIESGSVNNAFIEPYKCVSGSIKTPNSIIRKKYLHGSFTKREGDNYTIYSSSIWENLLRDNLSSICGVTSDKIKVISSDVTGEDEYPLLDSFRAASFTTLASSVIKKNVLYVPTPEDQYLYSSKLYGIEAKWQIAFNEENSVLGVKLNVTVDCGAYPVLVQEKVLRVIHGLTSYYKHRNILIEVKAVKSNNPPGGLTEGLYLSDGLFVSELLIGKIIKESKKDQYQFRNEFLLRKGFKNSSGTVIKKELPLDIMLKNIVEKSDFSRKNSSINLSLTRKEKRIQHSLKRGIGISTGYNSNGFISNSKDLTTHSVTVKLDRNEKVDLFVSCRLNSLDIINIWEEILSETLDVERENITITTDDYSLIPDSGPNISNKNISTLTPLIKQCADEIKARRFKDPLPIKQTKTTRRTPSNVWNPETWKGEPFKNSSYATCAVEVEIDKKSLSCMIKEIWFNLEIGQVLNKQALFNSVHREIVRTINWLQDPEPKIRDGEFSTYYFYNKSNNNPKPIINITLHETGKNKNIPKGVGSLIKNTLPGAYIQGVNQAIGANINTFPISKEKIYEELMKDEN